MNNFLINISRFLLPFFLPLIILELSVRNNTFKAKANYIHQNKDSIEVMILGSSQNWRAINPKYLSNKIAPLAHGGSAINLDFLLFDKYIELLPNLKVVIFELGYHNLEDYRDSNWSKNHLFYIYYGINNYDAKPFLNENFLLTANFKEYLKRFITPVKNQPFGQFNEYGFITESPISMFERVNYDSLRIENKVKAYLKNRHKNISKKRFLMNTKKLRERVNRCLKNDIVVVFLSPPKHYTYNDEMLPDKLKRRDEFLQSYYSHKNVYIWNFERTYEYQPRMFGDPDHLNPKGAEIFSIKIDSVLSSLINTNAQH